MRGSFTESEAEAAALIWLESLGWAVKGGAKIAPDGKSPERGDFREVVLTQRLRDALARLNPDLPQEAFEDAFLRLTHPEGATLEVRNRAFHRMLVDGVTVEYRRPDGSIAGAQARVVDFDDPENNDWLVESELGEIPEGWEVGTVGDHVRCEKGKSYKSEHLQDSDTALVTLKSFARGGGYRPDGLKSYTGDFKPEQVVRPGELVIACTDVTQAAEVIGRPALVQSSHRYATLVASLDVLIVRPKDEAVSVPFLYCLFRTDQFAEHTYAHTAGTTVLHLSKDAVPSYRFVRPPVRVVETFTSIAQLIFERIDEAERESRTLAALRDALLPKLISGELRVKDAERFIGRAL